jgi:hypothetical protein
MMVVNDENKVDAYYTANIQKMEISNPIITENKRL